MSWFARLPAGWRVAAAIMAGAMAALAVPAGAVPGRQAIPSARFIEPLQAADPAP